MELKAALIGEASPNWNFEVAASNEFATNHSGSNSNEDIYLSFRVKYAFNKINYKKKDYKSFNSIRLTQPVKRRYDVLLERYSKDRRTGWSALVNTL